MIECTAKPHAHDYVRQSTDRAVRSVAWKIKYDAKDPLSKSLTPKLEKTLFPDCFKESFIGYIQDLYTVVERLNFLKKRSGSMEMPLGTVKVALKSSRPSPHNKNVTTNIYTITHPHLFGCRDLNCKYSKINGGVTVMMYVTSEKIGTHHILTTIMSVHPVE